MGTIDMISNILLVVIIALVALIGAGAAFLFLNKKNKDQNPSGEKTKVTQMVDAPREDIYKFLPFDRIDNDMIIQDNGDKFTMVLECNGVDYYLMSNAEKISVEEGFIQFLNSLRFPIQLYVQTRTVNLNDSLDAYNKRYNQMQNEFNSQINKFKELDQKGASEEELYKVSGKIDRLQNILEYTQDLIGNISYLTNNDNVLRKKYYIVVPYHASEAGINNFTIEEIERLAYTELTTRCHSVASALSASGVDAHIITSDELADLIYIAVNRDASDVMSLEKAMNSGFTRLYSTAVDPIIKRKELEQGING